MHDNWLIAISLCTAGIGITMLMFAMILLDLELSTIDAATSAQDNTPIMVKGRIESSKPVLEKEILTITQPSSIEVVIEQPNDGKNNNKTKLPKGSCVIVVGKKSSYNDKAQIIASRITRCD